MINKKLERELESEIKDFEEEREKVRTIVGKIGGMPTKTTRLINIIFIGLVLFFFGVSLVSGGNVRFMMLELGILLLSIKLVYMLESNMKVSHYQFWILSSLEWRLDKIDRKLRDIASEEKETV